MHTEILSILGKTFEFKVDKPLCTVRGKVFYEWRSGDKCFIAGLSVDPFMGGSLQDPLITVSLCSDAIQTWEFPYSKLPLFVTGSLSA